MVRPTSTSDRVGPKWRASVTRDDRTRGNDVIVHLQASQIPTQTFASGPWLKRFTNLRVVSISLITTVRTSILI